MVTGESNTPTVEQWKKGIDNIKKLGADFIAFYGAEPLTDFEKLPEVVGYAEKKKIHTTVITSGVVPGLYKKLHQLYKAGAKSLTMSYDIVPLDKNSERKSEKALKGLRYFKSLGKKVRDVAIVTTLTKQNIRQLPHTIRSMSEEGIWTLFDLIHPNRGQEGSKCIGSSRDFMFKTEEDLKLFDTVMQEVLELKRSGHLVHTSEQFVELVKRDNHKILLNYDWNCGQEDNFPAWITIDCNGRVYCCDDFQPQYLELHNENKIKMKFYMCGIYDNWKNFTIYNKKQVRTCPGCCWNTHIDAHYIKRGEIPMGDYTHTN